MVSTNYPKGYRKQKAVTVDVELWDEFKDFVQSNGNSITFILMGLIKRYLEENKK